MKKVLILIFAVVILLDFPVCTKEHTYGVYEMTFSSELISNDSVGNDWEMYYSCDGRNVSNGEQWLVLLANPQTAVINVTVTERDKIPDIGSGLITVTLNDESETKTIVTVTENGGSYQGNEARWEITCKVKLIELR